MGCGCGKSSRAVGQGPTETRGARTRPDTRRRRAPRSETNRYCVNVEEGLRCFDDFTEAKQFSMDESDGRVRVPGGYV